MRKRILPALLSLVLLLSIMPVAFAAWVTVTIVQESPENPNQEFVYYISKTSKSVVYPVSGSKVETINNVVFYACYCGFAINSAVPDYVAIWKDHQNPFTGHGGYSYSINDCYKITLKHGEKVTINNSYINPSLLAIQADQYPVSYSADGKNFTDYVDNLSIVELDKSIAKIYFTPTENGTFTIRRTSANASENVPANGNPYKDVSTEDWFYPAVEYMAGKKYMTGYSDTVFAPNDTLSRAMFVTVLYRISGEKVRTTETKFTDVPQDTWYSEAVAWAVENGITTGASETTFFPNDPVSEEQMATFLKRYIDKRGIDMSGKPIIYGSPADLSASSSWAKDAVEFAYRYGLLYGTDGSVHPTDSANRTGAVVAFYNLLRAAENGLLLPYELCAHNWATRHVAEVGHYEESNGTHTVVIYYCGCGEVFYGDNPDDVARRYEHMNPLNPNACLERWVYEKREVPNDPKYVVDTPAHDEIYCTVCGVVQ